MADKSQLVVEVVAQQAIRTLKEIKEESNKADSAFEKLQKAAGGGFDRLEKAFGRIESQLGKIAAAMERVASGSGRVTTTIRNQEMAIGRVAGSYKNLIDAQSAAYGTGQRQKIAEFYAKQEQSAKRAAETAEKSAQRVAAANKDLAPTMQRAITEQQRAQQAKLMATLSKSGTFVSGSSTSPQQQIDSLLGIRSSGDAARYAEQRGRDIAAAFGRGATGVVGRQQGGYGSLIDALVDGGTGQRSAMSAFYQQQAAQAAKRTASAQQPLRFNGISEALTPRSLSMGEIQAFAGRIDKLTAAHNGASGAAKAHAASLRELGLGTSSLSRLLANTAVVIQGFTAFLGFREIVRANVTMQQMRLTLDAVSGSVEAGAANFQFAEKIAQKYGFTIAEVGKTFARYLASAKQAGDTTSESQDVYEKLAASMRILGKTDADFEGVVRAFEQIKSKGTVMAEELRLQLGDRIPGAVSIMAKAVGVSTQQLTKMMENGQVSASYLAAFTDELLNSLGGMNAAAKAGDTLQSSIARLQTALYKASEGFGKGGFNDTVIQATNSLTAFLSSAEGVQTLSSLGAVLKDIVAPAFVLAAQNVDLLAYALAGLAGKAIIGGTIASLRGLGDAIGVAISAMRGAIGVLAGLSAAVGFGIPGLIAVATAATAMGGAYLLAKMNAEQLDQAQSNLNLAIVESNKAISTAEKAHRANAAAKMADLDASRNLLEAERGLAEVRYRDAARAMEKRLRGTGVVTVSQIDRGEVGTDALRNTPEYVKLQEARGELNSLDAQLQKLQGSWDKLWGKTQENTRFEVLTRNVSTVIGAMDRGAISVDEMRGIVEQLYAAFDAGKGPTADMVALISSLGVAAQNSMTSMRAILRQANPKLMGQIERKEQRKQLEDWAKSNREMANMIGQFGGVDSIMSGLEAKDNKPTAAQNSFTSTLSNLTRVSDKLISGRVDWENYYSEIKKGNAGYSNAQISTLATISGGNDAIKAGDTAASELRAAKGGITSGAEVTAGDVSKLIKAYDDALNAQSMLDDAANQARSNMVAAKSVGAEAVAQEQLSKILEQRVQIENSLSGITGAADEKRRQAIDLAKAEATGLNSVIDKVKEEQAIKNRTSAVTDAIKAKEVELAGLKQRNDVQGIDRAQKQIANLQDLNTEIRKKITAEQELARVQRDLATIQQAERAYDPAKATEELERNLANARSAIEGRYGQTAYANRLMSGVTNAQVSQSLGQTTQAAANDNFQQRMAQLSALQTQHSVSAETIAQQQRSAYQSMLQASNDWVDGAKLGMVDYAQSAGTEATRMAGVISNAFKGMEDALVEFSMTGKLSFTSLANSIIKDLIRMQIQANITTPLNALLGNWISGATASTSTSISKSTTTFSVDSTTSSVSGVAAKGAYFDGGYANIAKFAKGGAFTNSIVSEPTLFKFAKGTGLMGEAGPEAIMPLERASDGSLGVRANMSPLAYGPEQSAQVVDASNTSNMSVNAPITVNVQGSSSGNTQQDTQFASEIASKTVRELRESVRAIVADEFNRAQKPGGMMNRLR